ncbi:hypothetical protein GCM10029964_016570 [Kibdelosporangium lantanae]
MRITFDPEADAAYVEFVADVRDGEAVTQIVVEDSRIRGEVVLDLDVDGRLLGVEILGVSDVLRPETVAGAEPP